MLAKFFLSMPLAKIDVRNLSAAILAFVKASLLTFAIADTDAFKRTESGVTFTVPVELTLMYRDVVAAWANCVPIVEARTVSARRVITRDLFDADIFMP